MDASLLRLRAAMKFSLWMWAAYWPGGGILLVVHGLDPISILVGLGALAQFLFLMGLGTLRPDPAYSRNLAAFLMERPLYVVFGLVAFLAAGSVFAPATSFALALFSGLQVAGLALVAWRLREYLAERKTRVYAARADQLALVLVITAIPALMVFVDALAMLGYGGGVGNGSATVALANWMNLAYPTLLMVAARPFREPIGRRRGDPLRAPRPVRATAS